MNEYDEKPITSLIRHCQMYTFASKGIPQQRINGIANDFFIFGLLHLISTMFITTDSPNDSKGGVFHRILDPLGYGSLLEPIDDLLNSAVGTTTSKQYIRSKRNKLTVHGSLKFSNQPGAVQEITFDENALDQFTENMEKFDREILILQKKLKDIEA